MVCGEFVWTGSSLIQIRELFLQIHSAENILSKTFLWRSSRFHDWAASLLFTLTIYRTLVKILYPIFSQMIQTPYIGKQESETRAI